MQASRSLAQRLLTQSVRRYHAEGSFKPPSMDELPVPRGPWQTHFDKKNRKYNITLLAGIGFTIFSLVVAKESGLIYLNYAPPDTYE